MLTIGVKYCGHCNPAFDGPAVIDVLKSVDTSLLFVPWENNDKDLLLVIGVCDLDCVKNPEFAGPIVHVAGTLMDGKRLTIEEMPEAIAMKISNFLSKR